MIRIAICDDEPLMTAELAGKLTGYLTARQLDHQLESFAGGRSLLHYLQEGGADFDLIFLDVQMTRPNGMETAKILRRQHKRSLLVFVTVLKECVFEAFEVEAFDYLVKPLNEDHLRRTLERALKALPEQTAQNLVVQRGGGCEVVRLAQIVYCEVQGRKIYIHRNDGRIIDYYERLDNLARRLDGRFFRCHRSYLVNLAYVRGCANGQITLSGGGLIPVSRRREPELRQSLLRYMHGGLAL